MEFFVLIFIGFVIFAIFAAIHAHKKEKERQAALAAWASGRGLYYHPDRVYGFDDENPTFRFLRQGSNRYAYNILTGEIKGREITAFDYHYETHSTDSKGRRQTHHHYFSAIIIRSPFPLKPLTVRREGFFDKMKSVFGFKDINFESSEFSRRFHVTCEDKRWAYDVIHNQTMQLLMDSPQFHLESDRRSLTLRRGKRFEIPDLEDAFLLGARFLDAIPDFVKNAPSS